VTDIYFPSFVTKFGLSSTDSYKFLVPHFTKIPPLEAVLIRAEKKKEGQKDGEADRKTDMVTVMGAFCHYAEGFKMV
jgi:hypothetical protein